MGKPASAAKPAVKEAKADEPAEVNTDHVRPGAVGDYVHQSEGEVIAAAAKDHKPGGDLEDA